MDRIHLEKEEGANQGKVQLHQKFSSNPYHTKTHYYVSEDWIFDWFGIEQERWANIITDQQTLPNHTYAKTQVRVWWLETVALQSMIDAGGVISRRYRRGRNKKKGSPSPWLTNQLPTIEIQTKENLVTSNRILRMTSKLCGSSGHLYLRPDPLKIALTLDISYCTPIMALEIGV